MHDVYTGTLGTFFNRDDLVFKLNELLASTPGSLSYEVVENRTKVVIITGANDNEKDIPSFQHPIIFDTVRGEQAVACDMRPYMKSNLSNMLTIREKLQDKYNGMFMLYRLILTKLVVDGEGYWLGALHNYTMESFAAIMKTITSVITYDETLKEPVDVASKLHFVSMDIDKEVKDKTKIIELLPRDDIAALLKGKLTYMYNKILDGEIILPSTTIGSLTTNIKEAINSKRADGLTPDIFIRTISAGYYSLDSRDIAIAMVEDKPTLTALLYMINTESINSKSTFRRIVNNAKRFTKPNDFSKIFSNIINEQFID